VKIGFSFIGVLGLIVAGCSSTGGVDGPVLTSPAELFGASGGMAAEVTGVLVYDESANCLLMELEGVQYPLVWPGGNEVAERASTSSARRRRDRGARDDGLRRWRLSPAWAY
jgi:hypothetical protein